MRPVTALGLADLMLADAPTAEPIIEWMVPADLLIDAAYQRDLSQGSLKLIRRIAEAWDWRRFKPPIVAWTERGFEVIDGQHTAVAAATRGLERLPVLVVEAPELPDRAGAFIGHNRDKLAVSPVQLHHAAVSAGDELALQVERVCARAGASVLRTKNGAGAYKVGETLAVGVIAGVVNRRGVPAAEAVLRILVQAGRAPLTATDIKAVELLMSDEEYAGKFEPEALARAIQKAGDTVGKEARLVVAGTGVPLWKAVAATWFRRTTKRRAP